MAWSVHNKRHRNQRVVVCVITNWNKGQRKGLFVCYKLRLSIGRVRVSSNLTSSIQWMVILPAPAQFLLHPTIEVKFTNCPSVKTQIHLSLVSHHCNSHCWSSSPPFFFTILWLLNPYDFYGLTIRIIIIFLKKIIMYLYNILFLKFI